jgi:hypothetical protein
MDLNPKQSESQYQSYLMRLWRTDKERTWRVMLECVDTHERHGFADIESLYAFLCEQTNGKSQIGKGI